MSTEESQRHLLGNKIWVDADACPNAIKEILYRVADRIPVMVTLVANQALQIPRSSYIRTVQVPSGFDVADNHIVEESKPGDLVITAGPNSLGRFLTVPLNPDWRDIQSILLAQQQRRMGLYR